MSAASNQDLIAWCAALVNGTISDEEFALLDELLATDAEARSLYVGYVHLHRALELWSAADGRSAGGMLTALDAAVFDATVQDAAVQDAAIVAAPATSDALPLDADIDRSIEAPPADAQSTFPKPAPLGPLTWLHSALTPRLIVLCIVGLLATYFGSLLTSLIRDHRRLAAMASSSKSSNQAVVISAALPAVERHEYSPDARWRDQATALPAQASQLLQLEAGTAQFDLTGGTRVVVAAPARFRIESAARVWLERGQLVARVGPQGKGFTVATPSSEVIDLGTEFGVEVDQAATTNVVVRQGTVDVKPASSAAARRKGVRRLAAGEGVRITSTGEMSPIESVDAKRRVAAIPTLDGELPGRKSGAARVLAWYRMGEDDPPPGAKPASQTFPNRAGVSDSPLQIVGAAAYSEQVDAPGSRRAIVFGPEGAAPIEGPIPNVEPCDDFVLQVWARVESAQGSVMIAHWGQPENGISIVLMDGQWCGVFQQVAFLRTGVMYEPGKWTQLAIACDRGQTHFYINGQIAGGPWFDKARPPDGNLTIGPRGNFQGQIDEVRLLDVRGGFRPEMLSE